MPQFKRAPLLQVKGNITVVFVLLALTLLVSL